MDELASAMGTSKSILYRYFEDRNGIREALAEVVTAELWAAIRDSDAGASGDSQALLEDALEIYLAAVAAEPEVYQFISAGVGCEPHKFEAAIPPNLVRDAEEGDDQALVDAVLSSMPYECVALASLGDSFIDLPVLRRAAAVGALRCSTMRWVVDRLDNSYGDEEADGANGVIGGDFAQLARDLALWLRDGVLEGNAS